MQLIAFRNAFQAYPTLWDKYAERLNATGDLDPEALKTTWVSMPDWIAITHEMVADVGPSTVYTIGKKITERAMVPPEIDSAAAVLMGMDVAFHMNHRREGVVMFDPQTGTMLDGIGHYQCELHADGNAATMTCSTPYPCEMDRGILAGFASRFEPAVSVSHASSTCRKKGDPSCVYLVQW